MKQHPRHTPAREHLEEVRAISHAALARVNAMKSILDEEMAGLTSRLAILLEVIDDAPDQGPTEEDLA